MTACRDRTHQWVISAYKCNYSAFNGYHRTYSDYSEIRCLTCPARWRTKAAYVDSLPLESEVSVMPTQSDPSFPDHHDDVTQEEN